MLALTIIFLILATAVFFIAPKALPPSVPKVATTMAVSVLVGLSGVTAFKGAMFYAQPGYIYHIRTITGSEKVAATVGWHSHLFGQYVPWKQAATIQARTSAEQDNNATQATSNQGPINIMFLDQVDAKASAMARFTLPTDREMFLKMAHDYRSFENLVNAVFLNSFRETLNATASLMTAEEYFSGGRTTFANEFEIQMKSGIYMVNREERVVTLTENVKGSANASKGSNQDDFGDNNKTIYVVEKVLDENGQPQIKRQSFLDYGITVSTARVTNMNPNVKFHERMQLKQKASADRAIAREQRVQEEEQRLLAIAKGEREVAERQAEAKVSQIEKTTNAETTKQLALTEATQKKERATIDKETAEINLEKAKVEAETKRTLADAEAYQKREILNADNALAQKLEAEIEIQKVWAEAYAKRAVPATVIGGNGSTPSGGDSEVSNFMQLMTLEAAKRLNYDRSLSGGNGAN